MCYKIDNNDEIQLKKKFFLFDTPNQHTNPIFFWVEKKIMYWII